MKNPALLIIILALGLLFVSYKWITSKSSSDNSPSAGEVNGADAIENIMTRTSVRSYTDEYITTGQIDTLLRAAMAAPTAGNKQPWRFVVIRDRATLDWIAENFKSMTMTADAPLAIVVCGNVKATFEGEGEEYWVQDASAATENLLLAAHAMHLGAVWCGVYPISERVAEFSARLELPDSIRPLNCVAVGHPRGVTSPKEKWNPGFVHYERWNGKMQ